MGAIDVIIPPGVPLLVYGMAAQESLPKLYAAGVLPGCSSRRCLPGYVLWAARRENVPYGEPFQ